MTRRLLVFAVCVCVLSICVSARADAPKPGKNSVTIRGQQQNVYFLAGAGTGPHRKILYAPGDGGWRGFGISIAENLAAAGYDVYGIDTRRYLQSFTGSSVLKTSEIASDFRELALWILQGAHDKIVVAGWSEGAGLSLVAASDETNRGVFAGLLALGMAERSLLAWRWKDVAAELTRSMPNEPTFNSADFLPKVSPLPLFVIASTKDEYVTVAQTESLFSAARDPKRLVIIKADDHKYGGAPGELFRTLREGMTWIEQQQR
jgi:fermentation-respiration switch protein FrsA (DUF1100 family)